MRRFQYPRKSFTGRRKLTRNDLREFGNNFSFKGKALIIFNEFPHDGLFEEVDVLPSFDTDCERYYPLLADVRDSSYEQLVVVGLLEHLKDPSRLIREAHRILKPGGKLYLSASAVYSVHRGPDDYFHVTQFGMKELLESVGWSDITIRGSCGPFKTVGILLQRILFQCETRFLIRPFVHLLAITLPRLDRFVLRQYTDRDFSPECRIDSMAPSNIQAIATK